MKEDMGKIQKDNKQGVVCIRCVRVLCRPSSRYRKAGTGLYTKKRDFLLHYSGAKKSRFFFCTTTQGGHAMKKYWKYSKEHDLWIRSLHPEKSRCKKSGKHVGKIYWKREKDPGF